MLPFSKPPKHPARPSPARVAYVGDEKQPGDIWQGLSPIGSNRQASIAASPIARASGSGLRPPLSRPLPSTSISGFSGYRASPSGQSPLLTRDSPRSSVQRRADTGGYPNGLRPSSLLLGCRTPNVGGDHLERPVRTSIGNGASAREKILDFGTNSSANLLGLNSFKSSSGNTDARSLSSSSPGAGAIASLRAALDSDNARGLVQIEGLGRGGGGNYDMSSSTKLPQNASANEKPSNDGLQHARSTLSTTSKKRRARSGGSNKSASQKFRHTLQKARLSGERGEMLSVGRIMLKQMADNLHAANKEVPMSKLIEKNGKVWKRIIIDQLKPKRGDKGAPSSPSESSSKRGGRSQKENLLLLEQIASECMAEAMEAAMSQKMGGGKQGDSSSNIYGMDVVDNTDGPPPPPPPPPMQTEGINTSTYDDKTSSNTGSFSDVKQQNLSPPLASPSPSSSSPQQLSSSSSSNTNTTNNNNNPAVTTRSSSSSSSTKRGRTTTAAAGTAISSSSSSSQPQNAMEAAAAAAAAASLATSDLGGKDIFGATSLLPLPLLDPLKDGSRRTANSRMMMLGGGGGGGSSEASQPKPCNCKKSKCLKLYCECFARQAFCDGCNCKDCKNLPGFELERGKAVLTTLERDANAFFRGKKGGILDKSTAKHQKGCNCKKSHCQKKYCECFQAGVPCSARCKCRDCKNDQASRQSLKARAAEEAAKRLQKTSRKRARPSIMRKKNTTVPRGVVATTPALSSSTAAAGSSSSKGGGGGGGGAGRHVMMGATTATVAAAAPPLGRSSKIPRVTAGGAAAAGGGGGMLGNSAAAGGLVGSSSSSRAGGGGGKGVKNKNIQPLGGFHAKAGAGGGIGAGGAGARAIPPTAVPTANISMMAKPSTAFNPFLMQEIPSNLATALEARMLWNVGMLPLAGVAMPSLLHGTQIPMAQRIIPQQRAPPSHNSTTTTAFNKKSSSVAPAASASAAGSTKSGTNPRPMGKE